MAFRQSQKTINELPQKLVLFAKIFAEGALTAKEAAIKAGYNASTATGKAYRWVGRSREEAEYPALWDIYGPLREAKLRLFEIDADNLTKELRIIAFSSIDQFLDLPSQEVHDQIDKLEKKIQKDYEAMQAFRKETDVLELMGVDPKAVAEYTEEAKPLQARIRKAQEKVDKLKKGPGYTLRLKFKEHIPAELLPAIAEIRETKDGIVLKLHNKLDGIDKLARYLKMYEGDSGEGGTKLGGIKEVNFIVEGTKSDLLKIA